MKKRFSLFGKGIKYSFLDDARILGVSPRELL
jgi:hypothetical protein